MNKKIIKLATIFSVSIILASCNNVSNSNSSTADSTPAVESEVVSSTPIVSETESEIPSVESTEEPSEVVSESTPDVELPSNLTFDPNKEVTITFYHTMNQNLKEILDVRIEREFNVQYPNIKVENVSAGGYDDVCDQLATSISAGNTVCDMAYCYPDHVALYNKANSLVVLDPYMYDSTYGFTTAQIDDFLDAYWEEGKSFGDNLMYSLPLSKSSEVMYYNADFFEENELNVPTHWFPLTENVDDDPYCVEYVCKKIKEIDPTCIPLGYDSDSNWFITLCEQFNSPYTSATGNHYLFNNEVNRDFVGKLKEWYDKGYFTTKSIYGQYTSNLFTNLDTSSARCYFCVGSSAGASNQVPVGEAFEVGIAPIPQVDAINSPAVISQGPNVCIFKNKDPQVQMACWLLLRFLTTSVNFQAEFSMQSGYTPVIDSVYRNQIYREFLDAADGFENITALSTKVAMEESNWYFTSPAFVGSSAARNQVGSLMASVFTDNSKTIAQHFEYAISELED